MHSADAVSGGRRPASNLELAAARLGRPVTRLDDVAALLTAIPYEYDWEAFYRVKSVRASLEAPAIMCIDAAVLAYGLLKEFTGTERHLLALHRHDQEGHTCGHVVAVYRVASGYGAFAKSNYPGLEHRPPTFESPHALAVSYARAYRAMGFTPLYFGFSRLEEVCNDLDWQTTPNPLNVLSERLVERYTHAFSRG